MKTDIVWVPIMGAYRFLFILPTILWASYYAWFINDEAGSEKFKYFPKMQVKYVAELGIESPGMSDSKSQYPMLPLY